MIFWITLGVFIFGLISQFLKSLPKKIYRFIFIGSIFYILLFYFYLIYTQYLIWHAADLTKYLVPPYRSIAYVIGYHFMRFALYYAISLFIALIFLFGTKHYNKKFQNKFFEKEEPFLGAIAIFLLGNKELYYAWIFYLVALAFSAIIGSLVYTYILKKNMRFPLYWLWLTVAIVVIIISKLLNGGLF